MNRPRRMLALSRQTVAWMGYGGRPTRTDWRQRFQLSWQSFWFERNLALSRQLSPLSPTVDNPVFILGLWRSGTTFLHNLLNVCPALLSPTTWQCMHPSLYRLHTVTTSWNLVQRPMDSLMIDPWSPQEDEFALLALGVPSVYRGFLDPRRLPELCQWLHPDAWSLTKPAGWFETWQAFLAGVRGDRAGRLLLKSPSHTFRIRALMQAFPQASYVWSVRDPAELWHSNRKMWLAMFRTYALWDWNEATLEAFLHSALCCASQCLTLALEYLPPERLAVVDFIRLTREPVASLRALNEHLQLALWTDMAESVAAQARQFVQYRQDVYPPTAFPAPIQTTLDTLHRTQCRALTSHGLQWH